MKRKGMGKGTGKKGYYNLIPKDKKVHADSAKGRKQPQKIPDLNRYDVVMKGAYGEVEADEGGYVDKYDESKEAIFVVPDHKKADFAEFVADDYGYSDYDYKPFYKDLMKNVTGEEILAICKEYKIERERAFNYANSNSKPRLTDVVQVEGGSGRGYEIVNFEEGKYTLDDYKGSTLYINADDADTMTLVQRRGKNGKEKNK